MMLLGFADLGIAGYRQRQKLAGASGPRNRPYKESPAGWLDHGHGLIPRQHPL
jgi:hypothetical protein